MACSSPSAKRRTTMRGSPSSRSSRTRKSLIGDNVENEPAGLVRHDLPPVLAAGCADRRVDDAEILGAVGIGQDDEPSLVMIDRVIVLGLARRDEARAAPGIGGVDQADLGGLVVVHAEQ